MEQMGSQESAARQWIGSFLGKLLKRGGFASRKKVAEITSPRAGKGNPRGHGGRVSNQQDGAGRQLNRMGSLPAE
jgi:hypothetical protein